MVAAVSLTRRKESYASYGSILYRIFNLNRQLFNIEQIFIVAQALLKTRFNPSPISFSS